MKKSQKGFSAVGILLIIVVLGLVGGVGWYVWSQKDTDKKSSSETSTTTKASDVTNFYDCVDKAGEYSGERPTCIYQNKSYTVPEEFTNDNVRNLNKVPDSARYTILDLAKNNFAVCKK